MNTVQLDVNQTVQTQFTYHGEMESRVYLSGWLYTEGVEEEEDFAEALGSEAELGPLRGSSSP